MDIVSVLILIITYKKCCMIDYGTTQMDMFKLKVVRTPLVICLTQGAVAFYVIVSG